MCLQEHWLYNFQKVEIHALFLTYKCAVKCIDDEDPISPLYRPRGQAGVASFWNNDIDHCISILPDGGDRVQAIKIQLEKGSMVLINTYLPTSGTHADVSYNDILDEVNEILLKYQPNNLVLWVGDMTRERRYKNDIQFRAFCESNGLQVSSKMPTTPTFHHFNGHNTSCIDLVIQPVNQQNLIDYIHVDTRNPLNTSSHDAITVSLNISEMQESTKRQSEINTQAAPKRMNWTKVDTTLYQEITSRRLNTLIEEINEDTPTEIVISRLNNILTSSADECSPSVNAKKNGKPKTFKWKPQLALIIKEKKASFWR